MDSSRFNRRQFIQTTALGATASAGLPGAASRPVTIVIDPADPVATAPASRWAAGELTGALAARGVQARIVERVAQAATDLCIVASGNQQGRAPSVPEALALGPAKIGGRDVLLAAGHDPRGLVYALLELADRVQNSSDPAAALAVPAQIAERPANVVRSVTRLFTSDVEDKPWYNDREMWPRYFTMLAAQRFNRFNLSFGIGYDFLRNVTDGYFLFAYPFLLDVPGYKVRVPQLPNSERDRNLEMLKFISEQTVARGMDFQLGIWMHGYEWLNSPHPNYTIEGLNAETHGPYCRDAVRALLKALPAVSGVTFRVHGESGVEEGSYQFWKTVFEGVATCGHKVEIDMHAKGMDQTMMDIAVATGLPVKISPKYWGEHFGMPYHQADIREAERPKSGRDATGLMKFSAGSRSFLRYGYGDLLREDRKWGVLHRIWPGTQRLLLWGDPLTAAAHSRAFGFCGSDGVEIMEPLSFKGRRGSGIAGNRTGYADASLTPRWDWEKYEYGHRIWGRLLYNPDASPDTWGRHMTSRFGAAGPALASALASASRILPTITTAHAPSAGNNTYWPEVYLNHSLLDAAHPGPYTDSPSPKVFGTVSPLDPQLFARINDFADELLKGERGATYSPIEVAQWIEDYAAEASRQLAIAAAQATAKDRPEYRRMAIDIELQAALGRFFGAKFRAGVLYRIHEQTGSRAALEACLDRYRAAREIWAVLANRANGVYVSDITVGEVRQLRGHWLDRLPDIDKDIALVAALLEKASPAEPTPAIKSAITEALGRPDREAISCTHAVPPRFRPGQSLDLGIAPEKKLATVRLYYRHVTQAERYESVAMTSLGSHWRATIPGAYTAGAYPIEYYFELRQSPAKATLHPGFAAGRANQPYFVVRPAG
ncbi:MAG: hypothetical protein NTW28_14335 [Candidatus Solibacter sp.]|nr:hypothetical protein [Candidatus Solibacter sp.]